MSSVDKISRILNSTSQYAGEIADTLGGGTNNRRDSECECHHSHDDSGESHHKSRHSDSGHSHHEHDHDPENEHFRQKGHSTSRKGKILDKIGAGFC